jgi:hypothetical protein
MGQLIGDVNQKHHIDWTQHPENWTPWQKNMYNFCDKAQKAVLVTAVVIATAGVGTEVYVAYEGTGLIASELSYMKEAVVTYHKTIGMSGGYVSAGYEGYNQAIAQYNQYGEIKLRMFDALGLVTAGTVRFNSSIGYQVVQGASSTMLTVSGDEVGGALVEPPNPAKMFFTTATGIFPALSGASPIVRGPAGDFLNETISGTSQGLIDRKE